MGKDKKLTQEEYKELFEKYKKDVLLAGEEARQMINLNHRPHLFITSKGRILSVGRERIKVLKQTLRAQTYTRKQDGNNEKKHCICINIGGKRKVYYVHLLVAEYFPDKISSFITGDEEKTVIHHIKGYDPTSDRNNEINNLIRLNQDVHCLTHSMKIKPLPEVKQKWRAKVDKALNGKHCLFYKDPDGEYSGVIALTDNEFELLSNSEEYKNKFLENYLEKKGII